MSEEKQKHLAHFASWQLFDAFLHYWVLLVMKTPEDVAIKAYKLTFLEILVLSYCHTLHVQSIPTYRVYWICMLYLAETNYLCFKLKTLKHCNVYRTTPTFCDYVTQTGPGPSTKSLCWIGDQKGRYDPISTLKRKRKDSSKYIPLAHYKNL